MGKQPEESEERPFHDGSTQPDHSPASGSEDPAPPPDDPASFAEENPAETELPPNAPTGEGPIESGPSDPADHHHHHYYPEEVTEPEPYQPEEEEEGGPVKTFLEHLEDLRWTLIKSLATLIIGMIICLIGANQLVTILSRPLDRANARMQQMGVKPEGIQVYLEIGSSATRLTPQEAEAYLETLNADEDFTGRIGDHRTITFRPAPRLVGTNIVLVLEPSFDAPDIPGRGNLINLGPLEGFKVAFQVAIYGGLGLASPFVLYFIGQFVVPALRRNERRYLLRALGLGALLFAMGVLFCYFVVIPIVLIAAVQFSHWMGFGAEQWQALNYIGVVSRFILGMGIGFELPIVILTLVKLDLLDYDRLVKFRMYWVVINLILSSVLTPPDPISMILMAVPLQILYEVSVFIARIWKRKAEAEEAAAG